MGDDVAPGLEAVTPVVEAAIDLFAAHGFEATSVEQIARAAGVSRSTFFRQFGGKEDVVFADHEALLDDLAHYLERTHPDPWAAVTDASQRVFAHYLRDPDLARRRYQVVHRVRALREREIVMVSRYERLFTDYLRDAVPGIDAAEAVGFAAVVTAIHNHYLRELIRGRRVGAATLEGALRRVLDRFGVGGDAGPGDDDIVVAVFPRRMPQAELARRLGEQLGG